MKLEGMFFDSTALNLLLMLRVSCIWIICQVAKQTSQGFKGWTFVFKDLLKHLHMPRLSYHQGFIYGSKAWKFACIVLHPGWVCEWSYRSLLECVHVACVRVLVWDMFNISSPALGRRQCAHNGTDVLSSPVALPGSPCPAQIPGRGEVAEQKPWHSY